MRTALNDLLGIEKPILCGGLMWLATAEYVAAVVKGGAMGFITPRSYPDLTAFRDALKRCADLSEGRRFGVNLYLSARPVENEAMRGFVEAALAAGVRVFETAGRSPEALVAPLKAEGAIIIHKVTTLKHAIKAESLGVDAVTLVGAECGGHPGMNEIPAMMLGALAAERLTCPFVIGGGIGHGRQLAAALALGASGVLMGSRMLVAHEIPAHPDYKAKIIAADEHCSITVLKSLGNTYRCLDNATARQVAAIEATGTTDYSDYGDLIGGALQKQAYETGDWARGVLSLGPAAAFADRRAPAADILERIMAQAALAPAARKADNPVHD